MAEVQTTKIKPYAIRTVHRTGITIPIRLIEKYREKRFKVEIVEEGANYFIAKFTEI